MRALPYVGLGVLAVVLVALLVWAIVAVARRRRRARAAATPWTHYCRPGAGGRWMIGVERVHGGRVLDSVAVVELDPDVDESERLVHVDRAKARALAYNSARAGH